jgi:hypothetical protein
MTNYNKKTEDFDEEKKETTSKEQKIRPTEKTTKKRGSQISIKSVIKSVTLYV